jgi:hypothetical protein
MLLFGLDKTRLISAEESADIYGGPNAKLKILPLSFVL